MRNCLIALWALSALFPFKADAQNVIPNRARPPADAPTAVPVATTPGRGTTISSDAKLSAGDELIIQIEEDIGDPPLRTEIGDGGAVDLNGLGTVRVADMTVAEARRAIQNHLLANYYHKATVKLEIFKKNPETLPASRVFVGGKVGRAGIQTFNPAVGMTLKEAVSNATTNLYSDLRRVKLTRKGETREIDVDAIINKGRTNMDLRLMDGDHIVVPAKTVVFGN